MRETVGVMGDAGRLNAVKTVDQSLLKQIIPVIGQTSIEVARPVRVAALCQDRIVERTSFGRYSCTTLLDFAKASFVRALDVCVLSSIVVANCRSTQPTTETGAFFQCQEAGLSQQDWHRS